jgi:three-Cys-motif partner protein
MMANHSFGGPWTERKLKCLRDYLNAYRTIFTGNPKARYFRTWYVDAFAGTGTRGRRRPTTSLRPLFDINEDRDANTEAQEYQDGSAKIALGLPSPFDNYLFIEKSRKRVGELQSVIRSDFSQLFDRCQFRTGDANAEIKEWCAGRDWSKERAVVFLDPYGMQVEWSTVETLAATKGVDLWYLFPGIARLLRRDGNIDEKWKARLDILLGTDAWRTRFFQTYRRTVLFGETEGIERTVTEEAIQSFILERLATCFGKKVAKGLILRNSKSSPLYFLCFAASNERGARPALNIANSILGD